MISLPQKEPFINKIPSINRSHSEWIQQVIQRPPPAVKPKFKIPQNKPLDPTSGTSRREIQICHLLKRMLLSDGGAMIHIPFKGDDIAV